MRCHRRIGAAFRVGGMILATTLIALLGASSARAADAPVTDAPAGNAPAYRAAILPTWNNHPHNVEYDYAFKELGMQMTHLKESAEQMDWLAAHLNDFNLLFAPPLFQYTGKGDKIRPAPYDMPKYAPAIAKWIQAGGCLYIVDANYGASLAWIKDMDPSLDVGSQQCDDFGPAVAVEPLDSILTLPKRAEYGFTWGHMTVPDQAKTGWKILARCGHGEPTLMIKRWGKGIVLISSRRAQVPQFLENIRVNQQFLALGVQVLENHVPDPIPGVNTFSVVCHNDTDKKIDGELVLSVTPMKKDADGKMIPAGEAQVFRQSGSLDPKADGTFKLDCRIHLRGPVHTELKLVAGGLEATCFDRQIELAPFFAVQGTRYRGILTTDRRYDTVKFGTRIFPDTENLADYDVRISVWDADGKKKIVEQTAPAAAGQQWIEVPLRRNTAPGEYQVRGEVLHKADNKVAYTDQTKLHIIGSEPGLTVFDEDRVMLHDGTPFFPLGIYHIGGVGGYTNDLSVIADMGFNTIQTFGWAGLPHVRFMRELGLKVLWEQMPHRSPEAARVQGTNLSGNPAMLMYYTMDEPAESQFDLVKGIDEAYHEADSNHPTFMASYQPYLFARNAMLSDVLAPDPYPYSSKREKEGTFDLDRVSKWMDRANAASNGNHPYMCVPQAFGAEPPYIWRNMGIQAIAHGAKGLIWYAWNEGEKSKSGMRYSPELRKAATEFIAQIKSIVPAILNATDRPRQFTAMDYTLHGMVCRDPRTKTYYLLLASTSKTPITFDLEIPELPKDATFIEGAFDSGRFAVANQKVSVKFDKYGSGIYSWGGPKPVVERPASDFTPHELPKRASGRTLNVVAPETKPVPANAYTSIQDAVNAAKDGDVIQVAEGTYAPFVSDNKLVDIVASGSVEKTIIDAAKKGRAATLTQKPFGDMSWQRNTLLRGFTIQNGDTSKDPFRNTLGGGVIGGTLENCVLNGNTAEYGGGAAYADLSHCTITSNNATKNGGAAAMSKLDNVIATNNKATWDGGAFEFCDAVRCEVRGNNAGRDGGGTHYGSNTSSKIVHNRARRNGGGTSYSGNAHTLIARNSTDLGDGGGIYSGVAEFCTVADNVAGGHGGGVAGAEYGEGWGVKRSIDASIVWNNKSRSDKDATAAFQYMKPGRLMWVSMKEPAPKGVRTDDPLFMSPATDDYRLQLGSPCIDAGSTLYVPRDTVDPDGNPRVQGGGADVGAYEAVIDGIGIGDWTLDDPSLVDRSASKAPFYDLTPDVKPVVKDGAFVFGGDFAVMTHASLRAVGAALPWWSKLHIAIEFKADQKGGTLFTPSEGKSHTMWVSVDPKSGKLQAVFVHGNPVKDDKTVFETAAPVTDGQWHQLTVVLDRQGGPKGFATLMLDGKAIPCIREGDFKGPYQYPMSRQSILGAKQIDNRQYGDFFHGQVKRLDMKMTRN